MTQFATVIPEGLKLHRNPDFASEIVTELAHGDRVKVLQRRQSPGGTMLAEVMVSRTKTGIQVGMVGWARDSLLQVEQPAPPPPPPDVPPCEPDEAMQAAAARQVHPHRPRGCDRPRAAGRGVRLIASRPSISI